jgi:hypothetical protein
MAVAKRSNKMYTEELALNERVSIEQHFAQQAFTVLREIKFGITPCCYVDYEESVMAHFISEWKYSASNKVIVSSGVQGIFLEPLAPINEEASLSCPAVPSNVCTVLDLESILIDTGTYSQCFDSPLSVWVITHNLGLFPSVTVVDSGNTVVVGDVVYVNTNTIEITFNSAFSGCAFLN